jgi:ATP adenylyltransferase
MTDGCVICAKFRNEGPLVGPYVWEDDLVRVSHLLPGTEPATLGHLIVETRRHASYLDGLTDAEAAAVGLAARNAGRALRAELDVAFLHSAIINAGLEHFHQHVYVRHAGTPEQYAWHRADEWPDAPHGDRTTVTELCRRLAAHFPVKP